MTLARHPAGAFFALSALVAVALPWLWLLPLEDARMTHQRLGLFGFGGAAIVGYVLTAARAWTIRRPPLPLVVLVALWSIARAAALLAPWSLWPAALPQAVLGVAVLAPVVMGRCWRRVPLAAVPLVLAGAEAGLAAGVLPPVALVAGLALLILLVGGRAIPAFLRTEATRRAVCQTPKRQIPLWPLPLLWLLAQTGPLRLTASLALAGLIVARVAPALRAGAANRMLALGWAMLAPAQIGLALAKPGPSAIAAEHGLLMAAMGGTVLAFAARAAMARAPDGGLTPLPLQWSALWLLLAAAVLRALATAAPPAVMTASALGWTLGWVLFLIAHLRALPRPAPFPVLSAARLPRAG